MLGAREAALLGATVVVAGGVAFIVWNYVSSSRHRKLDAKPLQHAKVSTKSRREEDDKGEEPLVDESAEAQKTATAGPTESKGNQVLVLGLDGAGKTSLLQCFSSGVLEQDTEPTQGFNAVSISKDDLCVEFLEIGGSEGLRPYWWRYMSKAVLLVFVVDSSKPQLFPEAKKHLHELVAPHPLLPLMVLAHKQDLAAAATITDLHDALALAELGHRQLFLIGTHVSKGSAQLDSGVQDARDIIAHQVWSSNSARQRGSVFEPLFVSSPLSERLIWGNQEPIWPLSAAALRAAASPRVQLLARHKRDFSGREEQQRKEEEEAHVFRKSPHPSTKTFQYENIQRLSAPKSRSGAPQTAGGLHTPRCDTNCPIWHLDPRTKAGLVTSRLLQLSEPKQTHPDYRGNRESAVSVVSSASKWARSSQRIAQLSLPRVRRSAPCWPLGPLEEPVWTVSGAARRATATPRTEALALPKQLCSRYVPPRDAEWSRNAAKGSVQRGGKPDQS